MLQMEKQNKERRNTVEDREWKWIAMIISIVECLKAEIKEITLQHVPAVSEEAGERSRLLMVTKIKVYLRTHMTHLGI